MSKQIETWRGAFGSAYIARNEVAPEVVQAKTFAWAQAFRALAGAMPRSILEVGANIGLNLRAIKLLCPANLFAVEPNAIARQRLVDDNVVPLDHVRDGSAADLPFDTRSMDLVFTSTVLIHVPPDELPRACQEIYRVSRRYVLCNEYFSDKPISIEYRGHNDLLFKQDFGAFWLDNFPDLRLVDYGFFWRRAAAMDNTTWWLFEKMGPGSEVAYQTETQVRR